MGIIEKLKKGVKSVGSMVGSAVKSVVNAVTDFAGSLADKIISITDSGVSNPEETDRRMVSGCHDAIEEVLGASPFEQFASLGWEDRQTAVVNITSQVAEVMGVDIGSIDIEERNDAAYGSYYYANNRISFNEQYLYEEPMTELEAKEVIDTIVHEVRHAYQHKAACRPSKYGRDKLTAQIWRLNFKHFVSPWQNMELYFKQPVEQDARWMAVSVMNTFE